MTPTAICPSEDDLKAYAWGGMPLESEDSLAEHLEACPRCEATVQTLERQGDRLLARLRVPVKADPYQQEPECRQIVDRLLDATIAFGKTIPLPSVSLPPLTSPGRFREYDLLEKLGEGSMGTVYKARHRQLGKLVAIKILLPGLAQDPQRVARFKREMKAVGQLDHPHVVRALDAGEDEGHHYLVMEYVKGLDLAKIVDRIGPLAVADACEIVRQVAVGLRAADERGLIHRDIKPSNLMLTPEGRVKILDLGLAVFETDRGPRGETTAFGQILGTLDYIAPEQINDAHAVDARADIYSLGCTLYKLLTGQAPFAGPRHRSAAEKMTAHLRDPVPPIRALFPQVPQKLAAVLEHMLAKDRDLRIPTPGRLVDELATFCGGADLKRLLDLAQRSPRPLAGEGQGVRADAAAVGPGVRVDSRQSLANSQFPHKPEGAQSVATSANNDVNKDARKSDFDPYHKWLGIPPVEQPPTHYRLLGLQAFESDPDVILGAVMRHSAHLKTYQLGQHAALTQKILNEVSAAKVCLLDPQRKAAYDERLHKELEAREKAAHIKALPAAKPLAAEAGSRAKAISLENPEIIPFADPETILAGPQPAAETGLADLFTEIDSSVPPAGSSGIGRTASSSSIKRQSVVSARQRSGRGRNKSPASFWQLCLSAIPPRYRTRGWLIAAGAATILLIGTCAAMLIVSIRDKNGSLVTEVNVPEGGRVEVREEGRKKASPESPLTATMPPPPAVATFDAMKAKERQEARVNHLDWEQDFDAAKKTAAAQNKSVFIFFDASESRKSSFASSRFVEAIALRPEFHQRAEREYVCVYIDNPETAEAQRRVSNAGRNHNWTERFGIKAFPTVVVTDPKGRPFGILEDYKINGINAFLGIMEKWEDDGKRLFALLGMFDAMFNGKDSPNAELAGEVLDFLELNKLDRFYANTIRKAMTCLPKGAGRPVTKELAEMWTERFTMAAVNPDDVKKVVNEFDEWKKTRTFKDRDMAGSLHLAAALILWRVDLGKEAAQKCREGIAFAPPDPRVRSLLAQAMTGEHHAAEKPPEIASVSPSSVSTPPPPAIAPFNEEKAKEHQAAWAKHLGVPVVETNSIGMKLVLIPPGEFMMGSSKEVIEEELRLHGDDDWYRGYLPGEGPLHRVRITKSYWLGATDVTQDEYEHVMGSNPSRFQGEQKRPVEQVSWDDATEFCRRLSESPAEKAARRRYVLPTEAQWEHACRAGTTTRWNSGDDEADLADTAWCETNAAGRTHPVAQKRANAWGLYDMHGNVWEWCQDYYAGGYYATSPKEDPAGPSTGSTRVYRGGGWRSGAIYCRSASRRSRFGNEPDSCYDFLGFRVVRVATGELSERNAESASATAAAPLGHVADKTQGTAEVPPALAQTAPSPNVAPVDDEKTIANFALSLTNRKSAGAAGGVPYFQFIDRFLSIDRYLAPVTLTSDQWTKLEVLKKEYAPILQEAYAKVYVLTPGQKVAGNNAKAKATAAKKTDDDVATAVADAIELTDDQKTQIGEARNQIMASAKAFHEKLIALLTPEQKAQLDAAKGEESESISR